MSLSACTSWPESGTGGMAEHYVNATYKNMHEIEFDEPITAELGLNFEIHQSKQQLAILILEGAERCFPASVLRARRNQARIDRELQANMLLDAANDLIIQRQHLHQLEQRLDYVRQHATCQATARVEQNFPVEQVDAWLNSDNQFAVDSAAINPKYMGHLARAAEPLRAHPQWRLQITGHTDNQGSDSHNQTLSKARAQQVSRYLQVFGIQPQRISLKAVASTDPLVAGSEPQVRLTNRRVTIRLLPPSSHSPQSTTLYDNSVPEAYLSDGWRPSPYPIQGGFIEYQPGQPSFTETHLGEQAFDAYVAEYHAEPTFRGTPHNVPATPNVVPETRPEIMPSHPARYSGLPVEIPAQIPSWAHPELLTPNATSDRVSEFATRAPKTLPPASPALKRYPVLSDATSTSSQSGSELPSSSLAEIPTLPEHSTGLLDANVKTEQEAVQIFDPNPISAEQNDVLLGPSANREMERVLLDKEVASRLDEARQ